MDNSINKRDNGTAYLIIENYVNEMTIIKRALEGYRVVYSNCTIPSRYTVRPDDAERGSLIHQVDTLVIASDNLTDLTRSILRFRIKTIKKHAIYIVGNKITSYMPYDDRKKGFLIQKEESIITWPDTNIPYPDEWSEFFDKWNASPQMNEIQRILNTELSKLQDSLIPSKYEVYHAFQLTPPSKLKVVILGRVPNHLDGHDMGLAYSIPNGVNVKSNNTLCNLYKEICKDFKENVRLPTHGNLTSLAQQGVLLVNTIPVFSKYTREKTFGVLWRTFVTMLITFINKKYKNIVYLFWGSHAINYMSLVGADNLVMASQDDPSNMALTSMWPDKGYFRKTNKYLMTYGKEPINWFWDKIEVPNNSTIVNDDI